MCAHEIIASADAQGVRLDRFVCQHEPALGRAAVRRMIEAGMVEVNGRRGVAGQRLAAGDRVVMMSARGASTAALPDPGLPLVIAYEDRDFVAADKPAGLPAHPLRPGELGTLASALLARYPEMTSVGYSAREPGIVHRLDTQTSGLMLAARNVETFARLRAALAAGAIDKRYQALCAGAGVEPGSYEAFLAAQGARVQVRERAFANAVHIQTDVLASRPAGAFTLVSLRVAHARRHQIRAHLAWLSHPIAGDRHYGGAKLFDLERHFLHASELHFEHPRTRQPISIYAPLPAELERVLLRVAS